MTQTLPMQESVKKYGKIECKQRNREIKCGREELCTGSRKNVIQQQEIKAREANFSKDLVVSQMQQGK